MVPTAAAPSDSLHAVAEAYFGILAESLPVCCLSDEFYFMPRAEAARLHIHRVDCLDRDHLEELCAKVGRLMMDLDVLGRGTDPSLRGMLRQSMESFLLHWNTLAIWKHDPTLYLRVAMIGLDHVLRGHANSPEEREHLYHARLNAAKEVLSQGVDQLGEVSSPAVEAGLDMADSCVEFLTQLMTEEAASKGVHAPARLEREERRVLEALHCFRDFLHTYDPSREVLTGDEEFQLVLEQGLGWKGTTEDARHVLEEAAAEAEAELAAVSRTIDPGKSWKAIYTGIGLPQAAYADIVSLYEAEVSSLETFFRHADLLPLPPPGSVLVEATPSYLEPIRATASYSAPCDSNVTESKGRFFIHTFGRKHIGEAERRRLLEETHRDYRYLAAHETCPGHHVLDWARMHLADPVRRQIESALFYEGWACYAEELVDASGYAPHPLQRLIRVKRQLWRALRGLVDMGLHTGVLTRAQGARILETGGTESAHAWNHVRRIALTPGYQLCYTLGKHCIVDLKRRFVPPLTLNAFHEVLLLSGQPPFDALEKAICRATTQESSIHRPAGADG